MILHEGMRRRTHAKRKYNRNAKYPVVRRCVIEPSSLINHDVAGGKLYIEMHMFARAVSPCADPKITNMSWFE